MAKSNEIRVLLLRTGQTAWDEAGRICGATDVPLTSDGLEAARQQAASLTGEHVSTILCGPDEASVATAQELAKTIGGKIKPVDGLGEVNLGLWEGLLE